MNLRSVKALMTSAGVLALTTGLAAAAPAVVGSSVNLRSGPGIDYEVIGALPGGATVDVMGCRGSWCQVNFGGMLGFASRGYLGIGGVAMAPAYERSSAYGASAPSYRYREGSAPGYGQSLSYSGERELRGARALRGEEERSSTRAAEIQGANPMLNPKNEPAAGANTRAEGTRATERSNTRSTRGAQTATTAERSNMRSTRGAQASTSTERSNMRSTRGAQTTTTGAGTSSDQQNRGPNFIGAGAQFKDNHP